MSDEDIKEISERLNNTPRKCLGWKTPAEVFREKNIGGNVMSALPYPKTNKSRGSHSAHTHTFPKSLNGAIIVPAIGIFVRHEDVPKPPIQRRKAIWADQPI